MASDLRGLAVPIVGAPMAGGPGTPALAAAVSNAGGLGFLAAGMVRPEKLASDIASTRTLTTAPFGVNLFVPQPSVGIHEDLAAYRSRLGSVADRYGTEPGQPYPDDDAWDAKLDLLADLRPDLVSFTFGLPDRQTLARFRTIGISTVITVTSPDEARIAVDAGADALVVQGPKGGGHRGTLYPGVTPSEQPLEELLEQIGAAHDVPLIAAGGLSDSDAVERVMALGAVAAQIGTALLLSDEAGTNAVHRAALRDPAFTRTVVTSAFTGRFARGLLNDFEVMFGVNAPLGYPDVGQITAPIRSAAVAAGDPHGTNLWAGTEFRSAHEGSVATIVEGLA